MTDIWGEKPRIIPEGYYYDASEMDAWLDRVRGNYLNFKDYTDWWMKLRELLREYLVDCNDYDIIFSQLETWREKAEKWDEEQQLTSREEYERLLLQQTNLVNKHYNKRLEAEQKLEAVKKISSEPDQKSMEFLHSMGQVSRINEILEGSEFKERANK